jgi:hypothetical protein
MNAGRRAAIALGVLLPFAAVAQEPSPALQALPLPQNVTPTLLLPVDAIVFDLQHAPVEPMQWGFEIRADGHGRYYAHGAGTPTNPSGAVAKDVAVSGATLQILLAGARHDAVCETHAKHIARTGEKTLSYVHGDAWFTCTFNYSDNEAMMRAEGAFEAMAETLEFGDRLERYHRFDRLSLDPEITSLQKEVAQGRAIEVENIAGTLRSIAEDERVIDRVRRTAARMVESVAAEAAHNEPTEATPR